MKISPNTLYYKRVDRKLKDEPYLKKILEIIEMLPASGLPTVVKMLKREMIISKKKVHRIMKENELLNRKRPKNTRKTTESNHKFEKYKNQIIGQKPDKINQIIVGDVTAYDVGGKNMYLSLLMDMYNREIVGAAISEKNNTELVLEALKDAKNKRGEGLVGCIHHTDADVRYCSEAYIQKLKEYKMEISMCVGNVYENAYAESLNKTIKAGEINISEYETEEESIRSIFEFIKKYNEVRPHSGLGWKSPIEFAQFMNTSEKMDRKNFSQK